MEISKLEKIEALFRQYDFMKIISKHWSNDDEYNNEALNLSLKLNQYDSVSSIQQKVWDVFYNYFCTGIRHRKSSNANLKFFSNKEEAIKKIGTLDNYLQFSQKIKDILDE